MRFTILIYNNQAVMDLFAAMSDDEKNAAYQSYFDVVNDLEASGELVDSKAIDGDGQRAVLVSGGEVTVTDVTDIVTVTGYYAVEVADEGRAVEIAARFPEARAEGGIRVARNFTQEDFDALGM